MMAGMATDPLQRVRDTVAARKRAEAKELDAILAALRDPATRQADVVEASGYTREHLRRIARANGIEAPTRGKSSSE